MEHKSLWKLCLHFHFFCLKGIYLEIVVASGEGASTWGQSFEGHLLFYCLPSCFFQVLYHVHVLDAF